jgi:hypothetical protein
MEKMMTDVCRAPFRDARHNHLAKCGGEAPTLLPTEGGINVSKIFGLGKGDVQSGGRIQGEDDLYIPFGLYSKKTQCDIAPKQVAAKGFIDAAIFDKLFDAVSYGERDKTQKKAATTTTGKQTRRERSL